MKQTPVSILCDWLISNRTLKHDVERWMSKDSHYAHNTEHGYNSISKIILKSWQEIQDKTLPVCHCLLLKILACLRLQNHAANGNLITFQMTVLAKQEKPHI